MNLYAAMLTIVIVIIMPPLLVAPSDSGPSSDLEKLQQRVARLIQPKDVVLDKERDPFGRVDGGLEV
jgi:hypothetical protein